MTVPLPMQVQVRAHVTPTERDPTGEPPPPRRTDPGPSGWALVFDTETTTELGQRLRLVTYQVRKNGRLREQGIAVSRHVTRTERDLVAAYCTTRGVKLLSREEFLDLFFRIGYDRRGLIIGFNLPFDLSRLARRHAQSKPRKQQARMRGGFTLTLSQWATRPAIRIKRVSARAAFIQFTAPEGRSPDHLLAARGGTGGVFRGYFADVGTLAAALLGEKRGLGALAQLLGVAEKLDISEDTLGGPITPQLLDYALRDVETTWACYTALVAQYDTLGLDTPAHRLYSEASVAKAHLAQIGVRPWRQVQPDAPDWFIATAMETYYGGRTETKIRRLPVPGVLTDVTSEYPTVFVLQQLWPWLTAQGVDWADEIPTDTTTWLAQLSVEQLLDPATWTHLTRLVLIRPGPGDLLPARADYAGDGVFNVAQAHPTEGGPAQWYTLADAAASTLASGQPPTIVRALAFTPRAPQHDLKKLLVAGVHLVDPYTDDLAASLVELRAELKTSPNPALRASAPAIKATVNSATYGIPIEVNTLPETGGTHVTVHRPDGSTYTAKVPRSEQPGQYFHPLLATWVAGAGRLLLALIMRMVNDAGGSYVFCDTDSVFIAATEHGGLLPCPGGPETTRDGEEAIRLLTWDHVTHIVIRLTSLNPYGGSLAGQSILKTEADNYDPDTGAQRTVYAYAVASKRYALYALDDGRPAIVTDQGNRRRSEHGLGHLLSPLDPRQDGDPGAFYDQWWDHGLHQALGLDHREPAWFDQPAIGRLTVTGPRDDHAFTTYNAHRGYDDQIRPWTFAVTATPTPGERARTEAGLLVAPYTRNPRKRSTAAWTDRDHPDRTYRIRTGDDTYIIDGAITVTSLRDYATTYFTHPEAKAAGHDGQPCRPDTIGRLQSLTVQPEPLLGRIGKETNRVTADTDLADTQELPLVYTERVCRGCEQPVSGKQTWCGDACRKRHHRSSGHDNPGKALRVLGSAPNGRY